MKNNFTHLSVHALSARSESRWACAGHAALSHAEVNLEKCEEKKEYN